MPAPPTGTAMVPWSCWKPARKCGFGVLVASALMLAACTPSETGKDLRPWQSVQLQDHPLAGRIWVVDEARFIPPHGLVERLWARKFVLLGERHDNPDHHRIQAWITNRLIARGRRPALVMEMFRAGQQTRIDAYLTANPGDSLGLVRPSAGAAPAGPPGGITNRSSVRLSGTAYRLLPPTCRAALFAPSSDADSRRSPVRDCESLTSSTQ